MTNYDPDGQLPVSGWYQDPANPSQERYWDGTKWSEATRMSAAAAQNMNAGYQAQPQMAAPVGQYNPEYAQQNYYVMQQNYYVMPNGPVTADGVLLSGWWRRVGAYVIDSILLSLVSALYSPFVMPKLQAGVERWSHDLTASMDAGSETMPSIFDPKYGIAEIYAILILAGALVWFIYGSVMLKLKGATVGMMALKLRVVPTDQGRYQGGLTTGKTLIRNLAFLILGYIPLVNWINFLMPLFTAKRQTLHDMIAGTQVVYLPQGNR